MLDKTKVKLGIAPIAWTNDDLPDLGGENTFEQCVSEMALAGFTGSEVGNKYPKNPEVLISRPYEETEKAFEEHVAFLAEMGAKVVGVSEQSYSTQGIQDQPIFEGKHVMNDEEWKLLTEGLNRLGKLSLEKYGVSLTFHHHMGTVVQTAAETDRLMAETDPAYVSLLYDSGHFAYCGEDPVELVKRYAARIKHVHLKDIRPEVVEQVKKEHMSFLDGVRAGAFTIPGDGCIDFTPIFQVLEETGYTGYMVVEAEQDPAKANPLEYAIRARKYIAEKTGL